MSKPARLGRSQRAHGLIGGKELRANLDRHLPPVVEAGAAQNRRAGQRDEPVVMLDLLEAE